MIYIFLMHLWCCEMIPDDVLARVVDTAGAEHEAVHAHAQVLALSLETLPDKHTGPWHSRHLTGPRRDLVAICNKRSSGNILQHVYSGNNLFRKSREVYFK